MLNGNTLVVLIERDYKGCHERYALTQEEFDERFGQFYAEGMLKPVEGDFETFTLSPLVHVGYTMTTVGSSLWNLFFTDMAWGLPEQDVEEGNLAYVRETFFNSLKDYVPAFKMPHKVYQRRLRCSGQTLGYRFDVLNDRGVRVIAFDVPVFLASKFSDNIKPCSIDKGQVVLGVVEGGRFVTKDERNVVEVSEKNMSEAVAMFKEIYRGQK